MFAQGQTYVHRNFIDVAMYVVKQTYAGPDYFKAKVIWVSQDGRVIYGNDVVRIPRKDTQSWKWFK